MPSQRRTKATAPVGVLSGDESVQDRHLIFEILQRAKLTMWAAEGPESNFAIRLWTRGAESVYGYSSEEALGQNYIDLIVNPAERDQAIEDHIRIVANDEEYIWDWSADDRAKDGTTRTVLTNCFPIWDPELKKFLLGEVAVDISSIEQASRKLRQLQAASIDRSHQADTLRGIAAVEGMYSSIATVTGGGDTLGVPVTAPAASAAVRAIVDGAPSVRLWLRSSEGPELADGSDPLVKPVFDEEAAFEELAASSSPSPLFIDSRDRGSSLARARPRGKVKAGAAIPIVFPFEMSGMLAIHFSDTRRITDSERASLGQLGLHLGVALKLEELSLELQRRREVDLLNIKSRALETALRAVFHKVSGPVHAISGGLEQIEGLIQAGASTETILERMALVRAVNDDVEAELGRFRAEREQAHEVQVLDLGDLCRAKAQELASRFPTVVTTIAIAGGVRVATTGYLASFLVSEAIEILFTNAAEAMVSLDGGGDILVTSEARQSNQVRLLVEDSGSGVPAELREQIWRRGMSTKTADGRERGDGLPAARDGIAAAGGTLQLVDEPGSLGGAVFSLTFGVAAE